MTKGFLIGVMALSLMLSSLGAAQRRLKMKPLPFELGAKANYWLKTGDDVFSLGGEILFEAVPQVMFLRADFLELQFTSWHNTLTFNTGDGFDCLLALSLSPIFSPYGYVGLGFTVAEAAASYNLRAGVGANIVLAPGAKLFGEGGVILSGDGDAATGFNLSAGLRFGR